MVTLDAHPNRRELRDYEQMCETLWRLDRLRRWAADVDSRDEGVRYVAAFGRYRSRPYGPRIGQVCEKAVPLEKAK